MQLVFCATGILHAVYKPVCLSYFKNLFLYFLVENVADGSKPVVIIYSSYVLVSIVSQTFCRRNECT